MSNEFEVPAISAQVEVRDSDYNDVEVDGIDFHMRGESATVEVTLMEQFATDDEQAMLKELADKEVTDVHELRSLLDEPAITPENIVKLVQEQSPETKLEILRVLLNPIPF